ncbi:MAG TPA: transmembrane 220 family protein [Saprospiraceae bacterium]|nr:transmembrane 220 family protein [Saprospiraceae bacterium]
MKIFSICSLLLGLICALIQINDPDPFIWIFAYFQLVFLAILEIQGKRHLWFATLVSIGYLISFFMYVPDLFQWIIDDMPSVVETMKAENQYIELVREGGGLLLCLIISLIFLSHWYKLNNKQPSSSI